MSFKSSTLHTGYNTNMIEEWRDVVGYEGKYKVSNMGNVYGKKYEKLLTPHIDKLGRKQVALCLDGGIKAIRVHRLVAKAFIPNPENKPQVNHLDNNPSNNNVSNLEWCTPHENTQHMLKQGRCNPPVGERQGKHVLSNEIVSKIKELQNTKTYIEISHMFGLNKTTVYDIIKNKTWKHI